MKIVIALLLLIAILPLPYEYYIYLRIIVFISLVFFLIQDWTVLIISNKAIYVFIALLFNPFLPIYLTKGIWAIIDIVFAIYMLKINTDLNKKLKG